MKHTKINSKLFIAILIISLLFVGYNYYKQNVSQRALSSNEFIDYINKYCIHNKNNNVNIEIEKDFDNLHVILLSYDDINGNQDGCFVVFDKLSNGKFKYNIKQPFHHFLSFGTIITSNTQNKDSKYYGFFYGIISDNNPNKYSIKINGKECNTLVERNKYFINAYEMGKGRSMNITPINDKE